MTNQAQAIREFIEAGIVDRIDETLQYFRDEFPKRKPVIGKHNAHIWASPISDYSGGITPDDLATLRKAIDLSDLLDVVREIAETLASAPLESPSGAYLRRYEAILTRARPYLGGGTCTYSIIGRSGKPMSREVSKLVCGAK